MLTPSGASTVGGATVKGNTHRDTDKEGQAGIDTNLGRGGHRGMGGEVGGEGGGEGEREREGQFPWDDQTQQELLRLQSLGKPQTLNPKP